MLTRSEIKRQLEMNPYWEPNDNASDEEWELFEEIKEEMDENDDDDDEYDDDYEY